MTRREILAETLARLEAERFQPMRRDEPRCKPPPPVSDGEAAAHARALMEALDDDPVIAAWAEREVS